MEYAKGRLFKDPSLPGMTAEERKVRLEKGGWGGGGGGSVEKQIQWSEGPRDWQNMFALTNFRYIEALFHLFYYF